MRPSFRVVPVTVALSFAGMTTLTTDSRPAHACGGCFVAQSENTQVSGHRMILSISPSQTTLYDQIVYDGNPSEFAWVLPIKGQVEVGLSSDALFQTLDANTTVTVNSPQINCGSQSCPGEDGSFGSGGAGSGTGGSGGGVTVIAEEVVGPYETVQLSATDPQALNTWLSDHGYDIPADIQPVIAAYVNEGSDFLALRLVPGQGVSAMRPVRVTTPGASPSLPLRMVAAGTGALTPISLYVIGEGRYEATNMPTFEINENELFWDWDTQSSNYATLRSDGFARTNGAGWLAEASEPTASWIFQDLRYLAEYDPIGSGYADENGQNAVQNAEEDIAVLLHGVNESSLWVSRLYAELNRVSLGADLRIGASASQTPVNRFIQVTNTVGTAPACPPPPDCGGFDDGFDGDGIGLSADKDPLGNSACAMGDSRRDGGVLLFGLAGFAYMLVRRRSASRR